MAVGISQKYVLLGAGSFESLAAAEGASATRTDPEPTRKAGVRTAEAPLPWMFSST